MLFTTVFLLMVITSCAFVVWPATKGPTATPSSGAAAAEAGAAPTVRPESLEGVLVAELMAGAITRRQYLRSIEGIAARDDVRHPVAVPPETGSANA